MKQLVVLLICFFGATTFALGQTAEENATVAYLQTLQNGDGGFLFKTQGSKSSSLSATSVAVRALKYFGGHVKDLAGCRQFVASCFNKTSGAFADHSVGEVSVMATSVGLMAAVDLAMSFDFGDAAYRYLTNNAKTFEDIRIAAAGLESIHKVPPEGCPWLQDILKLRNLDGTYGKADGVARDTGSAVVIVLRLGGKIDNREQVLKAMKSGQRADGGFGKIGAASSDLETSYRVIRAFMMLNEAPDAPAMRKFIGECRNADGGYGFSPGQPSNAAATYFAGIILHWLQNMAGGGNYAPTHVWDSLDSGS